MKKIEILRTNFSDMELTRDELKRVYGGSGSGDNRTPKVIAQEKACMGVPIGSECLYSYSYTMPEYHNGQLQYITHNFSGKGVCVNPVGPVVYHSKYCQDTF